MANKKAAGPARSKRSAAPADTVRVAVTFKRLIDELGLTKYPAPLTPDVVPTFKPDPVVQARAVDALEKRGFTVTAVGELSVSMRGKRSDFEEVFGTQLEVRTADTQDHGQPQHRRFFAPPDAAKWSPDPEVMSLIDDAYIQWPHIYMNQRFPAGQPSPIAPRVSYHHLRVTSEVPMVLNAAKVHRQGTTGHGVTVAMMDSEPPSSMLRAAPKKRFGRCSALASTPPVSTLPELGTTVL